MSETSGSKTPEWYDNRFDPYLLRVGRICGMFAHLEFLLNQAIAELANGEIGATACITAQIISPGQRMRALASLIHYRGAKDDLLKKVNKFSVKVEDLARQRNRYTHDSTWLMGPIASAEVTLKRLHITADRRYEFEHRPVDLAAMDQLHEKIRAVVMEFDQLRDEYLAALPPWPKTQFEQSPKGIRVVRGRQGKAP